MARDRTLGINPLHSTVVSCLALELKKGKPPCGAPGVMESLWPQAAHWSQTLPKDSSKPDVPGYANDVYFTGGKFEAYGGEVQVTDMVYRNSPAPKTLILGPTPPAPRNPELGLADVSWPSGLTLLCPLPSSIFQLHHSRKSLYSFQDLEDCPTLLIPKPRAAATSSTTPSPPAACAVGTRQSLFSP